MLKHDTTLTGAAGELFVMYRLCRMGLIAALAPKGVPNADIIVTDVKGNLTAVIQVKTRNNLGSDGGWSMKQKHEHLDSKNLYYCFVDLNDDATQNPIVYIIPSYIVAKTVSEAHKIWLETPGAKGQQRKDTKLRRLLPNYKKTWKIDSNFTQAHDDRWLEQYKENWSIFKSTTNLL